MNKIWFTVHGHLCNSPHKFNASRSKISCNSEELNNQIYQLESQINFLENKVRYLNKEKNENKINNKKLDSIKKERYTKALSNYEQIIKVKKIKHKMLKILF